MVEVYFPLRDKVEATININGKDVGYFRSFSCTFDNSPLDVDKLDSRTLERVAGSLMATGRFDRYHSAILFPDLIAIAIGEKLLADETAFGLSAVPDRIVRKIDDFSTKLSIEAFPADSVQKLTLPSRWEAQSFLARGESTKVLVSVGVQALVVTGGSPVLRVDVYTDSADKPGSSIGYATKTLVSADANKFHNFTISLNPALTFSTKYWLVIQCTNAAETIGAEVSVEIGFSSIDIFDDGNRAYSTDSGKTWTHAAAQDIVFYLTFDLLTNLTFKVKSSDGTTKEEITFKKLKLSGVEFTEEANALVIDTGTWTSEDIEVKAT